MLCVNQSSAFLLLPVTFLCHRIVEMSSLNGCQLPSSITLIPQVRPQKGQMTSLGSQSLPWGQNWKPSSLVSSQVFCPLHAMLPLTSSLQQEKIMCLPQKSVFMNNEREGGTEGKENKREQKRGQERRRKEKGKGKKKYFSCLSTVMCRWIWTYIWSYLIHCPGHLSKYCIHEGLRCLLGENLS